MIKEYSRLNGTHERLRKKYNKLKSILPEAERKNLLKQMRKVQFEKLNLLPYPVHDTAYKRIQYNRYADDFVIGVIGSKADAEQIKTDVGRFCQERCTSRCQMKRLRLHTPQNLCVILDTISV